MPIVGDASIVVDAETGPFDRRLKSDVTKSASGAGNIIKGILGAQVIEQGARAGLDLIRKSIDGASDLAESQSKVNVVFGEFAGKISAYSKAADSIGLSDQAALEATGTFGNLFTAIGLTQKQAANLAPDVVSLAADLASFNNIGVDEALEKLRSGLVGEAEPLRALGVNLTEADVAAKAVALGLAKTTSEVSQSAKVQARYALIMEQSKNAQGDFARTSDGLANKQRILSARFADLRATLGAKLLPVITDVTAFLADNLPAALNIAGHAFDSVKTAVAPIIENLRMFFNTLKTGFTEDEGTPIEELALKFRDFFENTLKPFAAFVQDNLKPILIGLGAAALLIASPVVAIGAAFVIAYTKSKTFRDVVGAVITQTTAFIAGIVEFVQTNMPKFQEAFEHVANAVVAVWNQLKGTIVPVVEAIVNTVIAIVGRIVDTIKQVVLFVTNIINGDFAAAFGNLKNIVGNVIGAVLDIIKGLVPAAAGLVVGVVSAMASLGFDIIKGLVRGIKEKASDVIDAIKKFVLDKVPGFVKKFFGIGSPSKMFAGFGANLMEGLAEGIRGSAGSPLDALAAVNARLSNGTTARGGSAAPGTSATAATAAARSVSFGDIVVQEVQGNPEATAFVVMSRIAAGLNL